MVFSLNPLDIFLEFSRRPYRLGDTISATVTLMPSGNVEIRTATLSLLAEVRRTGVRMGRMMDMGGAGTLQGGAPLRTNDYIPMQQSTEQKTSVEVCYSTDFLTSETLDKDNVSKQTVSLDLGPDLPKPAIEAKELQRDANNSLTIERWWLEVQVDVALGRDQSVRKEIDVALS